uniref:Ycf34 n=1 Tax=Vacuolaria virescens TaxID=44451 RepID=UPI00211504ED|nr:Ycf34 [Vacuolaria virescens]UTE94731.1 Ycf34 [Vacuolaria virescens]
MCICLNCKYINVCKHYNFVEKNHNELNITKTPAFFPYYSITTINFFNEPKELEIEWDVVECLSFKEKPGNWVFFSFK